jgi:hypothetical protein
MTRTITLETIHTTPPHRPTGRASLVKLDLLARTGTHETRPVTNGLHIGRWGAHRIAVLFDRYLGVN